MSQKIFVNLPVKVLARSIAFFHAIGYSFNPQFTDDTAACMVISDDIYTMLLTHDKIQEFTPRPVADATQTTEVLVALSCDDREEVGRIVEQAIAAGAARVAEPRDYGFMIQDGFQDPDGHIWEYIWMDPAHLQPA